MKFSQKKILKNDDGYTLVETVVALALLVAVLIPVGHILSKTMLTRQSGDLIVAAQLARMEMERTISSGNFETDEQQVVLNQKNWRIVRQVSESWGLVEVQVLVFKGNKPVPAFTLKTLRQTAVKE
jgi:type II secretory pathway pseudopilin PulG